MENFIESGISLLVLSFQSRHFRGVRVNGIQGRRSHVEGGKRKSKGG